MVLWGWVHMGGSQNWGQEEGRVRLQKPIHVRPTFGDRTFKPSYNSCNCNCSKMGDPRPTAGTPPGGWSVSVVTGPSHLGDLSRHVSWVYKTYFARDMYTRVCAHTHTNIETSFLFNTFPHYMQLLIVTVLLSLCWLATY